MAKRFTRLPHAVVGLGLLLGVVLLAETVLVVLSPFGLAPAFVANVVSSVLFTAVLVGGGYRLHQSNISTERYPRIAAWVGSGLVLFVLLFVAFTINIGLPAIAQISVIRWAAVVGGGGGMLVGLFEARAVERAVAAEHARVRAAEAERQNERLEEFSSIISHDLRNPLNVAEGFLAIARAETQNENLDRVASALDRMNEIVEDTLSLARQGRVIEDPEPVDLGELTERSWWSVDTGPATLQVDGTATITADADRVQQLFENMFRNAVQHAGTDVTVRVGTLGDGFYVEDDGPGIPEDQRERILEPGYTSGETGRGFGLAIIKQIAYAHGWTLAITESDTGGARFEITDVAIEHAESREAPPVTAT